MDEQTIERAAGAAAAARVRAHAPYSNFLVGACVVDTDGTLYAGCNVENASYGLTICAERTAVGVATLAGRRDIQLCVVVTDTLQPTAPCGACRQVLFECSPEMLVVSRTLSGVEQRWTIRELLPSAFDHTRLSEDA